jgi:hypothetical protein
MVEGVVADQVPVVRNPARQAREGLDPSALEEDSRAHAERAQLVQDPRRVLAVVGPIRMLGVECQGDPNAVAHFSTPVMTMPRMKARCAKKKTSIGITIVISVAAWMYCGSEP